VILVGTTIPINAMPRATAPAAAADHTPQTRLTEGALHQVVGYQLAQASVATTQVFMGRVGDELGLRPVEYTVLALVHRNPDATARQLARALAVTPPNIAVWIERLASRGLISRQRSTQDARMQHIRATPQGEALAEAATQRLIDGEQAALTTLSAAERAMLIELLHKVALARRRQGSNA
jgi:DNA-binding MarR family transcriptional regulator